MTSARAALDAALEAARAGARMGGAPRRPAPAAEPAAAAPAAPAPAAPPPSAPGAGAVAGAESSAARAAATAPWDAAPQNTGASAAQPQPAMRHMSAQAQAQTQGRDQAVADDEPPAWVTEFSDDTAVALETPAVAAPAAPARVAAPSAPPYAYVITPVPAIAWDGDWPALAASLPLRGVAQQLAFQTELVECAADGAAATFRLRVPVDTLRASGNSEKLCAALQERFPAVRVNVETEIAPTWYTASAEAKARRERLQREAEAVVDADPFVQEMARTFDAFVVPGSVRPTAA
jgi:DNA polymerase-3 subunit gamma/tau